MKATDSRPAPADDYPYYDGHPTHITGGRWWFVMFMVAAGFAVLVAPIPFFKTTWASFLPAILFCILPLIGLRIVAPRHWTAIFRKLRPRDFLWMVLFTLLNLAVTLVVGLLVMKLYGANPNPAVASAGELDGPGILLFAIRIAIQLLGEELISILPFLAIMYFCFSRLKCSRRTSIVVAWLLSAAIFGLAHLGSYDWNFVQCLIVIGVARLMLTLPYMLTKNLWVSTGVHILNDYIIILGPLLATSGAAGGNG